MMSAIFRLLRPVAVSIVVVTLVGVATAMAIGLTHPEPVPSGALGPDWQCARLALVFTSCTRIITVKSAPSVEPGKAAVCPRVAFLRNSFRLIRQ
jgi:hypothetical protein